VSEQRYIRIRNWARYQHYKDRRPAWIKLYVSKLDDYELTALDYPIRLAADELLLVAALTNNAIPNDLLWLSGKTRIDQDTLAVAIKSLANIGFLSLADRKRSASKSLGSRASSLLSSSALEEPQASEEKQIYDAWLSRCPPLIAHDPQYFDDPKLRRKATAAIERHGLPKITKAIENYAAVLGSDFHWFSHRYPLADFLQRDRKEPGITYFLDEAAPLENFRARAAVNGDAGPSYPEYHDPSVGA
jgi:hypothetical protein